MSMRKNLWIRKQMLEITQSEENKGKRIKKSDKPMWSLGYHKNDQTVDYWNSEEKEKEKMVENLFKEITAENIPHADRDLDFQVH